MILKKIEKEGKINCLIESSNIHSTSYDTNDNTLLVVFKNGGTYKYKDIWSIIYEEFETAESQGKILNQRIKKQPFTKLEDSDIGIINESFVINGWDEFNEAIDIMYKFMTTNDNVTTVNTVSVDKIIKQLTILRDKLNQDS